MVNDDTLIGYIVQEEPIIGTLSTVEELVGEFTMATVGLIGELTYGSGSIIPKFEGPYFTVPTAEIQVFETKDKKMIDDFTVDATPISDVKTVETDGYTITVL